MSYFYIYPIEYEAIRFCGLFNWVNVLKSEKDDNNYVNYTNDLRKRLIEHEKGTLYRTSNYFYSAGAGKRFLSLIEFLSLYLSD